jgi:replication-associated recombination protein RarA
VQCLAGVSVAFDEFNFAVKGQASVNPSIYFARTVEPAPLEGLQEKVSMSDAIWFTSSEYEFWEVLSAMQKSIRRGLEDEALFW